MQARGLELVSSLSESSISESLGFVLVLFGLRFSRLGDSVGLLCGVMVYHGHCGALFSIIMDSLQFPHLVGLFL